VRKHVRERERERERVCGIRRRRQSNIKMILKVGYVGLDWIHLYEERNVVNTVMNYFHFFFIFNFFHCYTVHDVELLN